MKKMLILSASAGIGHLKAAEALQDAAAHHFPEYETLHLDILDCGQVWFKKFYGGSYLKIIKDYPKLWFYIYHISDEACPSSLFERARKCIERMLISRRLLSAIQKYAPDYIICTHFMPVQVLAYFRKRITCPVWVQITDFDCHRYWVEPFLDGYCVGNEGTATRLHERGIPSDKIHVTGIPIAQKFTIVPDRDACAKEIGADPSCFTLLIMFGGHGVQRMDVLVQRIFELAFDMQIIAIAGKNKKLFHELQILSERYPRKLFAVGFTDVIQKYMAVSDCAVTKAGGLSVSECLAMGLPMIIVSPIAGQEEHNTDYLVKEKAALKALDASELMNTIKKVYNDRGLLVALRKETVRIRKPHAGRTMLEVMLS